MTPTPESTKRPSRTSMEGMIWNANHILEQALSPHFNGVPKNLFKDCSGVVLVSIVEYGLIFSGNVGTGILLKKNKIDKTWSPPSAIGMKGVGFGALIGASVKDLIVFLDDDALKTFSMSTKGVQLGTQAEVALGNFGRNYAGDLDISGPNSGMTFAVAFTKGAFAALSLKGGELACRADVNKTFYGQDITPTEILNADHGMIPSNKLTLLDDVYHKLELLEQGETLEKDTVTDEKKEAAAEVAEKAAEEVHAEAGDDVVHVDAAAEAAKEVFA